MVVTEGFAGNIALKAAEGTARQIGQLSSQRDRTGPGVATARLSACARRRSRRCAKRWIPRKSNGGVFLGLNGIVIKSHGGTDAEGFAGAIDMGYDMVRYELLAKIGQTLAAHRRDATVPDAAAARRRSRLVTMLRSVVLGCGSYLPSRVLTNEELSRKVDTSDEWIVQRTGIRERHIAAAGETDLRPGDRRRRERRSRRPGVDAQSIDLIVLATSTPDKTFPASAVTVQAGLGITHGAAFDLQAVCSGFVYGLATADGLLQDRQRSSARW